MHSFIPHTSKKHNWKTVTFILIVTVLSFGIAYFSQTGLRILKASASIQQTEPVNSQQQVTIDFPLPVIPSTVESGITITPAQNAKFSWENGNKRLRIIPSDYWKPESKYSVTISQGKNILFSPVNETFYFSTESYPALSSVLPVSGQKDVAVDIEDPIIFNFDRSLKGYGVKFEINPEKQLEYQLSDDMKTIRLLSKDDFQWNTRYTISVFIKLNQEPEQNYRKIGEMFFDTALPPPPVERSNDPSKKLEEALLYTKPQILEGKYIDINLKYQTMVIFENGKALDAYLISSGKRGMETPVGTFSIHNKTPRAWSKAYSLFMPYWMAFLPSGAMGIHELPEWPGGYKEGANHLGIPVSHGCVRLGVGPAKRVYDWAEIGTPVIIY